MNDKRPELTDYEKAMLVLMAGALEYLHVIAWNNRSNHQGGDRVEKCARNVAKAMQGCGVAADFFGGMPR